MKDDDSLIITPEILDMNYFEFFRLMISKYPDKPFQLFLSIVILAIGWFLEFLLDLRNYITRRVTKFGGIPS